MDFISFQHKMLTLLEKKKMQNVVERTITLGRGVFILTCN